MKRVIAIAATILFSMDSMSANIAQGTDTLRSKDGTSCSSQVATPSFSVSVEANQEDQFGRNGADSFDNNGGKVMFTYTVPLEGKRKRLDCERLYEIELQKAELELQQLKMAIEQQRRALEAQLKASQQTAVQTPVVEEEVVPEDLFSAPQQTNSSKLDISKFTSK